MFSRLDDELLDHPKLAAAGRELGRNGRCLALGFYTYALMWCNRHLSDGLLPVEIVETFSGFVVDPLRVAEALQRAGLFDTHERGYRIHDYGEYNPSASEIKAKRKYERNKKRAQRAAMSRGNGRA